MNWRRGAPPSPNLTKGGIVSLSHFDVPIMTRVFSSTGIFFDDFRRISSLSIAFPEILSPVCLSRVFPKVEEAMKGGEAEVPAILELTLPSSNFATS